MNIITRFFSLLAILVFGLSPAFALAADVVPVSATANVTATVKLSAAEGKARDKGSAEIDRRTVNLNEVSARISAMKNLTDQDKSSIAAAVSAQVSALAALKTKIAADTDSATLKTDVQSVTGSYRIYVLLIPQVRIISASDRIVTISNEMGLFSAKLQSRISAAQASGSDMTAATAALADFTAKVSDAHVQAQAAVSAIATLVPDGGDKAKLASNTAALKDARAKVVAGQKDLRAARADADVIIKAVKGKPVTASVTASSTASVGQ